MKPSSASRKPRAPMPPALLASPNAVSPIEQKPLSLGAWQRRSELVQRVHSILRRNNLMHPVAARVLLAAIGCSLLAVTVELARCPQLVAFVAPAHATANPNIDASAQLGDTVLSIRSRKRKSFRAASMQYRPKPSCRQLLLQSRSRAGLPY